MKCEEKRKFESYMMREEERAKIETREEEKSPYTNGIKKKRRHEIDKDKVILKFNLERRPPGRIRKSKCKF